MTFSLEYHVSVRHSILASLALFSLCALPAILVSTSYAQVNGAPASVTSPGFGGRPINGTPPSVTSLGPNGSASNSRITFLAPNPLHDGSHHGDSHRRHHEEYTLPPVVYPIAVPYAVDLGATSTDNDNNSGAGPNGDDRGDPTAFDDLDPNSPSRKNLPRSYPAQYADVSPTDPEPQEPTLLIFKDGRKLEVSNYAILGVTLFDLTPGHARKIALADLDLEATQKQNDDRGVTFQIPPPVAN
jgi:hypothetical protein